MKMWKQNLNPHVPGSMAYVLCTILHGLYFYELKTYDISTESIKWNKEAQRNASCLQREIAEETGAMITNEVLRGADWQDEQ